MSTSTDDTAWKLGMQLLLRQVIADTYYSADRAKFQEQLDGLLRSTLTSIETGVHFPGAIDGRQVKEKVSEIVASVIGSIKPA